MKNRKIDLENIKVAIFDFDDTLAIHQDKDFAKHRAASATNFQNYYINAYLNPETFFETIEPCDVSNPLQELIQMLRSKDIKLYCLTGMKFSFHFKAKANFVHKYYGDDIEVFSTGSQELKDEAVKMFARLNHCNLNEILFVDDMEKNIIRFNNLGIHALFPSEVDTLLEKEKDKEV